MKRPYEKLGLVRSRADYTTLDPNHEEADLCRNYYNKAVRDLIKRAKDQGADAVIDVKSVVFFEDGRHSLFKTPECSDDGSEGQILVQGIAVRWKGETEGAAGDAASSVDERDFVAAGGTSGRPLKKKPVPKDASHKKKKNPFRVKKEYDAEGDGSLDEGADGASGAAASAAADAGEDSASESGEPLKPSEDPEFHSDGGATAAPSSARKSISPMDPVRKR